MRCSAASSTSWAVPVPSCTMAVSSPAVSAMRRSRALSLTMATYSFTLAAVGVISMSWRM